MGSDRPRRPTHPPGISHGCKARLQRLRPAPEDVVDVFVYAVVLNLAIEWLPSVISEGFTLSLLTAVLLKVALEVVLVLKGRVRARWQAASSVGGKVVAALLLWATAAGSKFAVLEVVNVVFGDLVQLGGFVSVTVLVVALLLARGAVRSLLAQSEAPRGEGSDEDADGAGQASRPA